MSEDEMIRFLQKHDQQACRYGPYIPVIRLLIKFQLFFISPIARAAQRYVAFERYSLSVLDATERYLAERKHVH